MPHLSRLCCGVALGLALLLPLPADAHGLWGHVHVTGWAVENMPDDELRQFLLEPEVFNALIFGATFTDTGYSVDDPASRAYSEHTHWEPFVEDYIQWIRENDPPPWTSSESKRRVAFLLGCASHGMQDEIFDSTFLHQAEEHDGVGQDATDPASDGFLALDQHLRFFPKEDIPLDTLLQLYEVLDQEITEEVIDLAVGRVTGFYVNDTVGPGIASQIGKQYEEQLPWMRQNYLNSEIPGSLRSEIFPTMAYQRAVWDRLHEGFDANSATVFGYPEAPRRLLGGVAASPDSWVTLVFGIGLWYSEDMVELEDDQGNPVSFTTGNSQWGPSYTRLVRLRPDQDLVPGGWYTARLVAGVETIHGQISDQPWELRFQVPCDENNPQDCPDLGEIPEASIDGLVEEEAEPPPGVTEPTGCGCAHPAGVGGLWGLGLAAVALRRRRG